MKTGQFPAEFSIELFPQNGISQGVEGAQADIRIGEQFLHAFPHFLRRFGGESQRQNRFGLDSLQDSPLDAPCQHGGFSRAGGGKDHQRAVLGVVVEDRISLIAVEAF